ncbi:lysophospholipid acyltransferase family protein [Algisphaera agarilytica]|uniref:1-acyl-sn-glycerol-3-phosphate acyltransferase n=1 Tax=Algisphaera agarilytica TaxID=1385975 RepID=A0A7X0H3K3_9BACT|nr:lysophospholipid acyltransferase family protein [Algisphaera agarilytica]MBB6428652.1 1-acyl-sn-glycerol-3-phosphate acyltransferase [Algisphaera agarilytica]
MRDFDLQPAKDLGLPEAERAKSLQREPGLVSLLASHAWWGVVRVYLKLFHRLAIEGRQHLPAEPPFVLVANHSSHLDALALAAALPARHRRYVFPISAGDVFFETKFATAFSALCLNALPMWRKNAGRHAMGQLRERLAAGDAGFILFPEGTRSPDGVMKKFRAGVGMLVAGTDVPIVPCYIDGAYHALPKGSAVPRPRTLKVTIGPPLRFADQANDKAGWSAVSEQLHGAVEDLRP